LQKKDLNFKSFDEKECPSWFYYINSQWRSNSIL
jgi:hypothetical protein